MQHTLIPLVLAKPGVGAYLADCKTLARLLFGTHAVNLALFLSYNERVIPKTINRKGPSNCWLVSDEKQRAGARI